MTLPIVPYGDPMLRKMAQPITADYPELQQLIADMYETFNAVLKFNECAEVSQVSYDTFHHIALVNSLAYSVPRIAGNLLNAK